MTRRKRASGTRPVTCSGRRQSGRHVPRSCHTQAKSLDELMVRIREAIELCLEVEGETREGLDFVGLQRVTVT